MLLIGNQMNGFTYTRLAEFVEEQGYQTVTVPHYEASLEWLQALKRQPIAIICSGNNANYPDLPMFEYYGEYEIIRETKIPLLGICCGHQSLAMAHDITFARSMGWQDFTVEILDHKRTPPWIRIKKKFQSDPVFAGMKNPFHTVEIHGWAISPVALVDEYEVLSDTEYIQAIRSKSRSLYGAQFHGEANPGFKNEGAKYVINFLKLASQEAKRQ